MMNTTVENQTMLAKLQATYARVCAALFGLRADIVRLFSVGVDAVPAVVPICRSVYWFEDDFIDL